MLRKTCCPQQGRARFVRASMRPQRNAAENTLNTLNTLNTY